MNPSNTFDWTPHDGDTVHLRPGNAWSLPAGRYRIHAGRAYWNVRSLTAAESRMLTTEELTAAELAMILTPIGADELARERQEVQLRAAAPLRQNRRAPMLRQHDASDLALFRAAAEPRLAL